MFLRPVPYSFIPTMNILVCIVRNLVSSKRPAALCPLPFSCI